MSRRVTADLGITAPGATLMALTITALGLGMLADLDLFYGVGIVLAFCTGTVWGRTRLCNGCATPMEEDVTCELCGDTTPTGGHSAADPARPSCPRCGGPLAALFPDR